MDLKKLWKQVLEITEPQVSPTNFVMFFKTSSIEFIDERQVTLSVVSAFTIETVKQRHLPLIEGAFEKLLGQKLRINFSVHTKSSKKEFEKDQPALFQPSFVTNSTNPYPINPKYTLQNFVVGPSNNIAFAAAQAIVGNPGFIYNPLYVYGGTGVGKTHLMLGIGNAILKQNPDSKIIYCSSEKFMNDYVEAIQSHKMTDLRKKYRQADLMLIDDIQFFSGREGTQEEFFHTFNELQTKNSQMVFTSDRPPHEIAKLEDRLKSRFAGGLMVDIQSPDFDTRVAILQAKCQEKGETLSEEALKLIASSMESNIRELEGKLMQIIQSLKANNAAPTAENIASFFNIGPKKLSIQDPKEILNVICNHFNVSQKELSGPKRQKELVLPRHITMFLLTEELGLTVERVGQLLGGRDHTTVMHGRDRVKKLLDNDREIQRIFSEIRQKIQN